MSAQIIHVLSIEDNQAEAFLIQEKVEAAQRIGWNLPRFEIEHVSRLQAALARLEEGGIDVVLSDLDLPDSRAGNTVATLREHIPHMPLVVLTAREDEVLAHESVRAGVQDYLYKDEASGSLLVRTLMYAIERQQARAQLEVRVAERTEELQQANAELRQTNRALRESEARERARTQELETIMDTVPAVIWVAEDPGCRQIRGNAASYRMLQVEGGTNTSMTPDEGQAPAHFKLLHEGREVSLDELPMQRACFFGETTRNYEGEIVLEDGTRRIILGNTVPLRDNAGQVQGAISAYVDITGRKRTEEALQRSKRQLQAILNSTEQAFVLIGPDYRVQIFNHIAARNAEIVFNLSMETGQSMFEFILPQDEESFTEHFQRALRGETVTVEKSVLTGQWFLFVYTPIQSETGEVTGVCFNSMDITGRKQAEKSLQESKARYRRLLDALQEGVWSIDTEARTTFVNPRMAEMLGYTEEEMLGMSLFDFMDEVGVEDAQQRLARRQAGVKEQHEFRFLHKAGHDVYALLTTAPILDEAGQYRGAVAGVVDITERKRADIARRRYTENLRAINQLVISLTTASASANRLDLIADALKELTHALAVAVSIYDAQKQTLTVNHLAADSKLIARFNALLERKVMGLSLPVDAEIYERITGEQIRRYPDLYTATMGAVPRAVSAAAQRIFGFDRCIALAFTDGDELLGSAIIVMPDAEATPSDEVMITFARIVTAFLQRWDAESTLQKREARFRLVAESSSDAIFQLDLEGQITYCSPAVERLLGWTPDDVIGSHLRRYLPKDGLAEAMQNFERAINAERVAIMSAEIVDRAGRLIPIEATLTPVFKEEDVIGVQGAVRDITERQRAEEALRAEHRRQLRDLDWLTQTAERLLAFTHTDEILVYAAGILQEKLGDCLVLAFTMGADEQSLRLERIHGIQHTLLERVMTLMSFDPRGRTYGIIPEFAALYTQGHLRRYEGGLAEFAASELPPAVVKSLTKLLKLHEVYTIGLVGRERVLGNLHILARRPHLIQQTELVESFAHQVSLALEQAVARGALKESEEKLRNILENSTNLFYSHTADHELTYVSPQVEAFLQCTPEEAMVKWMEFATENPVNELGFASTEKAIETGETQPPYELEVIGKQGRKIWVEVREAPVVEDGETVGIVGSLTDITERKRAEEALLESEERYRRLVEGSPDILYIYSDQQGALYWSRRVQEVLGYAPEDLVESPYLWHDAIHPDDVAAVDAAIMDSEKGAGFEIEYRVQDTEGNWRWFHDRFISKRRVEGEYIIEGLATDITERKEIEESLRQRLIDLRLAQEIAKIGNWQFDPAVGVPVWSEQVYEIYNRDPQLGPPHIDDYANMYKPKQFEIFNTAVQAAIQEGKPYDIVLKLELAGGVIKWIHAICQPDEERGPAGHFLRGTIQDITERKQVEEALRDSERRFRTIVHVLPQFVSYVDKDLIYRFVNRTYQKKFEVTPEEIVGKTLPEVIGELAFADARPHVEQVLQGEYVRYHERYDYAFGETRDIDGVLVPDFDEAGEVLGYYAVLTDITPYMEMQMALRQYAERLQIEHEIDTAILRAHSTEEIARAALERLQLLIPCRYIGIAEIDFTQQRGRDRFIFVDGRMDVEPSDWYSVSDLGPHLIKAIRSGDTISVDDLAQLEAPSSMEEALMAAGIRAYLSVPLLVQETPLGTLNLASETPHFFQSEHIDILEEVAASLAVALQQARLLQQTREDAETKALLLREVNHRVKNNLDAIIGLLYVERRHAPPEALPAYAPIMEDLSQRIRGLARVHQMLSDVQWAPLNLSELAEQIIQTTVRGAREAVHVTLDVAPASVHVGPAQAQHLALILSELTTNTLKYAVRGRDGVHITVRVTQHADTVTLVYRNDGPGYPEDVLRLERYDAGLDIISRSVRKNLNGKLKLYNEEGAVTEIRFKVGDEQQD